MNFERSISVHIDLDSSIIYLTQQLNNSIISFAQKFITLEHFRIFGVMTSESKN